MAPTPTPDPPAALPAPPDTPDDAANRPVPTAVYFPAAVFEALKTASAGTTYTEWLLQIYYRHHKLLAAKFPDPGQGDSGLPPRPTPRRRNIGTPTPAQLRPTRAELAVLDAHRTELGGPSRSAFFTALAEIGLERGSPMLPE